MATLLDRFGDDIARSASLPARPEVLNRLVCVLGGSDDVSLPELAGVIRQDAALAGGVLRMANAAAYGGKREISSLSEALLRIGLSQTGRLALALSLHNMIPRNGTVADPRAFWLHSLGTATAASVIVGRKPGFAVSVTEESAFLMGLFHDVGLLALAGRYGREYIAVRRASRETQRPYHSIEPEVLGTDHGALGALIVRSWGLPEVAVETVRVHHASDDVAPEVLRRVKLVQLAETVCLRAGLGDLDEGDLADDGRPNLGSAGISPDEIDEIVGAAREETERSDALLSLAC